MSEVKRYEMKTTYRGHESWDSLEEDKDGSHVSYEDYAALEAKCEALAAENARLKSAVTQQIELRAEIKNAGMPPHADFWVQSVCEAEEKVKQALEETPATDAFMAEVRAQCLNAFIQHHSAELDAHIKNGGEQFDEKSVRIRDVIVSARLFREQIRKGAAL